jgi:hypothetical protein
VSDLGDELRLLLAIALNALVIACAARFVCRRITGDRIDAAADTLLVWLAVQYVAVGLPGLAGVLNWISIALAAMACSAWLWWAGRGEDLRGGQPMAMGRADLWSLRIGLLLVGGYIGAVLYTYTSTPTLSIDAMAYHLPAAVQWLQTGRIGLFETWYYNPANTYSPLGGSVFLAWWLAPVGNESLARFAQTPAIVLTMLAMICLCRRLGASVALASAIGAAAVLSRPLLSQQFLPKDDLYVAAFFAYAVAAMARMWQRTDKNHHGLDAVRLGISLGLLVSIKYTALLALPMLLVGADAVRGWRRWAIALGTAGAIAGPWFVRNAVLTGNPLYPLDVSIAGKTIFEGLFTATRSPQLAVADGVWHVLAGSYHSLPPAMLVTLAVGWVLSVLALRRQAMGDPIFRAVVLGGPVGFGIFLLTSPYPEIRFLYPVLLLAFACCAAAIAGWLRTMPWAGLGVGAATAVFSAGTAFVPVAHWVGELAPLALAAVALGVGWFLLRDLRWRDPRARWLLVGSAIALLAMSIYVRWHAYLDDLREEAETNWAKVYGPVASAWRVVREPGSVPEGSTIAYANTYLVYPLQGFDLGRRVVHVPVGRSTPRYGDLPRLPRPVSGEELESAILRVTLRDPDQTAWLTRLRASGARFLFVAKHDLNRPPDVGPPVELDWARSNPRELSLLYENEEAAIYRVGATGAPAAGDRSPRSPAAPATGER